MRNTVCSFFAITLTGMAALYSIPAFADDSELGKIKTELETLLAEKEAQEKDGTESWFNNFIYTGLIQLEAISTKDFIDSENTIDLSLATVQVGVAAALNKYTVISAVALYEDGGDPVIDIATVHFSNEDATPFSLTLGKTYVSFGAFETNLINNSLALELAEMRANIVMAGYIKNGFDIAVYVSDNNAGDSFGGLVGYTGKNYTIGIDYINDISGSDFLAEEIETQQSVGAFSIHGTRQFGDLDLILEYVQAEKIDVGERRGDKFSTFQAEAVYPLVNLSAHTSATVALSFQRTHGAAELLPEQRLSVGVSMNISNNVQLATEYWHDIDYHIAQGGSGKTNNSINAQLAFTF